MPIFGYLHRHLLISVITLSIAREYGSRQAKTVELLTSKFSMLVFTQGKHQTSIRGAGMTIMTESVEQGELGSGWVRTILRKPSTETSDMEIVSIDGSTPCIKTALFLARSMGRPHHIVLLKGRLIQSEISVFICGNPVVLGRATIKATPCTRKSCLIRLPRLETLLEAGASLKIQISPIY